MAQPQSNNPTVPHYALPNVTSRLPAYTNAAAEAVRGAFVPNSYHTIAAGVRCSRRDEPSDGLHKGSQLAAIDAPIFKAGGGQTGGLFSEFVYESSPYDVLSMLSHQTRELSMQQAKKVSERPFVVAHPNTAMYGRQTQASDDGNNSSSGHGATMSSRDPFDAVRDDEFRHRWLEEHHTKPFLPGGKERPLQKPSRALLTDIMTHMYRVLCEDWAEAHPTVLATSEDLIVVYFAKEGIKNEQGIQAYMSVFARRNDVVLTYDLRRVNEGWNVSTEDGHLMYSFRPPWVRQRSFLTGATSAN